MGYFSKKADPVSQRARTLERELESLEAQIQRLNTQQEKALRKRSRPRSAESPPKRANGSSGAVAPAEEAVFEEVKGRRLRSSAPERPAAVASAPAAARSKESAAGASRRRHEGGALRKLVKRLQGPPPSNPKLVNYLAAGSIQGLRPLRYEKRVARNRVLFLLIFLVLLVLGILTSFIRP